MFPVRSLTSGTVSLECASRSITSSAAVSVRATNSRFGASAYAIAPPGPRAATVGVSFPVSGSIWWIAPPASSRKIALPSGFAVIATAGSGTTTGALSSDS